MHSQMKDFLTIEFEPRLDEEMMCGAFTTQFPEFSWRRGDSDSQGRYISGTNDALVQIKCWMGEKPMDPTVSFRCAWIGAGERQNKKNDLLDRLLDLLPVLGRSPKITECD